MYGPHHVFAPERCRSQQRPDRASTGLTASPAHALSRTALDYYTRAVNADPRHRAAAESAAQLLELGGLAEFALPFYDAALRADPARDDTRRCRQRCRERSYCDAATPA